MSLRCSMPDAQRPWSLSSSSFQYSGCLNRWIPGDQDAGDSEWHPDRFDSNLGQRFGVCCGFFKNFRRHFPDGEMKLEHRLFRAATPAVHFPVGPNELRITVRGELEQQRMLAAIKLLRKS